MTGKIKALADFRILLIAALIVVSTLHVGLLFAEREATTQWIAGYILALAIDGVLVIALYDILNVSNNERRRFAGVVFGFACLISAGFNFAYYRQFYPQDHLVLSGLLGLTPPILAGAVAVLRALQDVERTERAMSDTEAERQAELQRYAIEQAEQTKRVQANLAEHTRRLKIQLKAEQNSAPVSRTPAKTEAKQRRTSNELNALAQAVLLNDPDIGVRALARELDVAPSTASAVLKRVRNSVEQ